MLNIDNSEKAIVIAVSVAFQDAGEATRSIEIIDSLMKTAPDGYKARAVFFSHGSKFDKAALERGYGIYRVKPAMEGKGYITDLHPTSSDFIGTSELASEMLKGEIEAIKTVRPDLVLFGFWPLANLARRMVKPAVPGICFLPLPFAPEVFGEHLMKDVPDIAKPLTYLPLGIRRRIAKIMPVRQLIRFVPNMRQKNIIKAAYACGWQGQPLRNLFDLLKSELVLVNDCPEFYKGIRLPSGYIVTGPIYADETEGTEVSPEIKAVFSKTGSNQINIFCSMGSSAFKNILLEAVKAIASLPSDRYHAVILVPSAICGLADVWPYIKGHANIYATSAFVPASLVNPMADITICHGGQGTVQTALASKSPLIGVAMQPEQQINIDNAALRGAGIRIPITRWKKKAIEKAISKISSDSSYKDSAVRLSEEISKTDGRLNSAKLIWQYIGKLKN